MAGSWCSIGAVLFVQQDGRSDSLGGQSAGETGGLSCIRRDCRRLATDRKVTRRLPINAYGMKIDGLTSELMNLFEFGRTFHIFDNVS